MTDPKPPPAAPENQPAAPEADPAPPEFNPPIEFPPINLTSGGDTFLMVEPLDEPTADGIFIYRSRNGRSSFENVCMKLVNAAVYPDGFNSLRNQVELNNTVGHHPKILNVEPPFTSTEGYYCVIFPYMDMGSVRWLMSTQFPNGIPETNISIILKDTLQGLAAIHAADLLHKEISAGHIYLDRKSETEFEFKQGFAASIHDFDILTMAFCLPDAVDAPEVPDTGYTAKADIWLLGIMALELAFGGSYVTTKRELLELLEKMNRKKRLPKKLSKTKWCCSKKTGREDPFFEEKMKRIDFADFLRIKNPISDKFQDFLLKCLDFDPQIRPNAQDLLNHRLFTLDDDN